MTRVLLATIGSGGDVDPMVGLGRVLKGRGHAVTLLANGYFEKLARGAGLDFAALGTAEEYLQIQADPAAWDSERGYGFLLRKLYLPQLRPLYHLIAERYEPGRTVVAGPLLAMGARVANEKIGVPLASILFQPSMLSAVHESSGSGPPPGWATVMYRKLWIWARDFLFVDRLLGPDLAEFRRELGLPSVRHHFWDWTASPQLMIGLFPDWFAPSVSDWPAQLRLTGFPLYDEAGVESLPEAARQFLDAGEPPIIFTFGTGMQQAREIFAESVAACRQLGRRGLLLTRYAEQIPADLPSTVQHFAYIPFSQVLPRAAALVHHGGVGTLSQALRAGVPQLVVPFAYDQPDNATRLERLGVAGQVAHTEYRATVVAGALQRLLGSSEVAAHCQDYAGRVRKAAGLEEAARAVEELATRGKAGCVILRGVTVEFCNNPPKQ
jgi:UDP:flavonoid glycosyltransferase YjiC (YdhE family)